jgi:multimeric flavodoxin WrbA
MRVVYIGGSGRKRGNTDILIEKLHDNLGGEIFKISDLTINHCLGCWSCRSRGECRHQDDMDEEIIPSLRMADVIVLATPVYFNNVSSLMKMFMDRTWPLRNLLKDKLGAAIAVGQGYGTQAALDGMNSFFLKHEMIPVNRGISGEAFQAGEILEHRRTMKDMDKLIRRIVHLHEQLSGNNPS